MSDVSAVTVSAGLFAKRLEASHPPAADEDVKAVARAAFVLAIKGDELGWLHTDDLRFRAAVGALLLRYKDSPEPRARIEYELRALQALSAAQQGVPVDFAAVLSGEVEPLGLLGIYNDTKARTL